MSASIDFEDFQNSLPIVSGSIFLYKNFKFPDGTIGNKLVVVLSKENDLTLVVCLTTSNIDRERRLGNERVEVMANEGIFEKDTSIQTSRVSELPKECFDKNNEDVRYIRSLPESLLMKVIHKVTSSKTIERKHIKRLKKEYLLP